MGNGGRLYLPCLGNYLLLHPCKKGKETGKRHLVCIWKECIGCSKFTWNHCIQFLLMGVLWFNIIRYIGYYFLEVIKVKRCLFYFFQLKDVLSKVPKAYLEKPLLKTPLNTKQMVTSFFKKTCTCSGAYRLIIGYIICCRVCLRLFEYSNLCLLMLDLTDCVIESVST